VVEKRESVEEKPKVNIGETLFGAKGSSGGNTNPFSMGGGAGKENPFSTGTKVRGSNQTSSSMGNPFSKSTLPESKETKDLPETFAQKLNLNNPQQTNAPPPPAIPWPEPSSFPALYPKLYLVDADYEILDRTPEPAQNITVGTMDIEDEGSSGGGGGKEDKEVFESEIDKTFQKFADRVGCNPEQVLRYEFAGSPLLYSKKDAVGKLFSEGNGKRAGMQRCGNCGRERVFECQLTPHAIMELERDEVGVDGMDWGTIIVGVCAGDCVQNYVREGEVAWIEEWVGVQWEDVGR
jgi:pre-rRNA-processing protein TSR4